MKKKLQVFVSSTFVDLKPERQAAVEAILKAGHIPAGMELFTAGDKSQMKTIERWIDESDVYMLILGGRYGSIEATTGLSYTEIEYDYAVIQGKPFFAVVVEESALENKIRQYGTEFMEKDNRQQLARFRLKVLSKASSFFVDAKDIKLCVHESLSEYGAYSNLKGWVAGSEVPDIKSLQDEIAQLRAENANLKQELKKRSDAPGFEKFSDLRQILELIEIEVPAEFCSDNKRQIVSLLKIAYGLRESLVSGVYNSIEAKKFEKFLYYDVLPKLMLHGLADNEKVAGVAYRRSFLNSEGRRFLAFIEKDELAKKGSKPLFEKDASADKEGAGRRSGGTGKARRRNLKKGE